MTERDKTPLLAPGDIAAAIGLLTRLPVPVDGAAATQRGAAAAWAYPVAGLVVAVIACFLGSTLLWLGLPPALTAGFVLGAGIVVTGAMHEDGLADSADGLWGGWDTARRLEIMKDSSIGAYGVLALGLTLLIRWQALVILIEQGLLWPAVIATAIVSRSAMVWVMGALAPARTGGLSRGVGRPAQHTMMLAGALGLLGAMLVGSWAFGVVIAAGLTACLVALIARRKIGGQTGDILGATQQCVEITTLVTLAALAG